MPKKEHFNFDLNFLEQESPKKTKAVTSKKKESDVTSSAPPSFKAEWIPLIAIGVFVLGGIYVALASSNRTQTPSSFNDPAPAVTNTTAPVSNYDNAITTEAPIEEEDEGLECNEGFCPLLDGSRCVPKPHNAHCVESRTDNWLCDVGYREEGNSCMCISENFQCSGLYLTRVNEMDSEIGFLRSDLESTYVDEYDQYSVDAYNRKREVIIQKLKERDQYLEDFCVCTL